MHRLALTIRYSRAMVHLALAVIALVLGHDVMMAIDPGQHGASVSHHEIALEQCGPEDGVTHGFNILPNHLDAEGALSGDTFPWMASHQEHRAGDVFALDGPRLRAFLQVYLN